MPTAPSWSFPLTTLDGHSSTGRTGRKGHRGGLRSRPADEGGTRGHRARDAAEPDPPACAVSETSPVGHDIIDAIRYIEGVVAVSRNGSTRVTAGCGAGSAAAEEPAQPAAGGGDSGWVAGVAGAPLGGRDAGHHLAEVLAAAGPGGLAAPLPPRRLTRRPNRLTVSSAASAGVPPRTTALAGQRHRLDPRRAAARLSSPSPAAPGQERYLRAPPGAWMRDP